MTHFTTFARFTNFTSLLSFIYWTHPIIGFQCVRLIKFPKYFNLLNSSNYINLSNLAHITTKFDWLFQFAHVIQSQSLAALNWFNSYDGQSQPITLSTAGIWSISSNIVIWRLSLKFDQCSTTTTTKCLIKWSAKANAICWSYCS